MKSQRTRLNTYVCIVFVSTVLACTQKANQQTRVVSSTSNETNGKVVKRHRWEFRADPYGINDLQPESDVKALEYGNSGIVGSISKTDKDQLALLAARLPILRSAKEINSIIVTSPTNVELFVRTYRIFFERTPTNTWKIVNATYFTPHSQ